MGDILKNKQKNKCVWINEIIKINHNENDKNRLKPRDSKYKNLFQNGAQ